MRTGACIWKLGYEYINRRKRNNDVRQLEPNSLLKNLLAFEESAAFGGSSAAVADDALAVERNFWRRSLFRQAANINRNNNSWERVFCRVPFLGFP